MCIAVMGTGSVGGGFFAALAKAGADVTFIARGAHLTAMQRDGLRITGGRGENHLLPLMPPMIPLVSGQWIW